MKNFDPFYFNELTKLKLHNVIWEKIIEFCLIFLVKNIKNVSYFDKILKLWIIIFTKYSFINYTYLNDYGLNDQQ